MERYDVIVIGGGAAGLMAAARAAECGAQTLLLEKMAQPGRKLRITGKGRCNVTNVATIDEFLDHFGRNGRFLRQAFTKFISPDLIQHLTKLGVQTVVERGGRVFPVSNEAQDIVDALTKWGKGNGVILKTNARVKQLIVENSRIVGVQVGGKNDKNGKSGDITYAAAAVIIATGGASYPATGSTGDGYALATALGHEIVPIRAALVPLVTAGDTAPRLQGLSLQHVSAHVWINGKKSASAFGEMLFTHFGLSGPIILSLSRIVVDALQERRSVVISIDLKPALDEQKLDARLLRDLTGHSNRQFHTILKGLLPAKLIPVCIDRTNIPADREGHQITKEERKRLRIFLKDLRLEITNYRPLSEAIITAGGVALKEIDPRTMASRLIPGLFFAGEVLDLDADTGGYNLQAAFSTGWLAGEAAASFRGLLI